MGGELGGAVENGGVGRAVEVVEEGLCGAEGLGAAGCEALGEDICCCFEVGEGGHNV